jgi:hypothetical protein
MTYFEVLVEGASDVPVVRQLLTRRFNLVEGENFRIHPHKGRGKLPTNLLAHPDPKHQTLLHQLPAKLRGFSYIGDEGCVLVVVDADDDSPVELLTSLSNMLDRLPTKPPRVMFRLAVEETESWFLADEDAIRSAFPRARLQRLRNLEPDQIVGAWDVLADALKVKRSEVTGADKFQWAEAIAPYLDIDNPRSPSLKELADGVEQELRKDDEPV